MRIVIVTVATVLALGWLAGTGPLSSELSPTAAADTATVVAAADGAQDWSPPPQWRIYGGVLDWSDWDAQRYRNPNFLPFLSGIFRPRDQIKLLREALTYDAEPDSLSWEEFIYLTPREQQRRRELAHAELDRVRRFQDLILQYVQYTREEMWSANWTTKGPPAAIRKVTECMHHMVNAAGLDPTNPWNWHDLAYFLRSVGYAAQSRLCLDAALAALDLLPEDIYAEMRLRIALDYAWLERNDGFFDESLVWVGRAEAMAPHNEEAALLRGLDLAGKGDLAGAFDAARKVSSVKIRKFPLDIRTAGSGPELLDIRKWRETESDFASRWIQALAYLADGKPDLAAHVFGSPRAYNWYPYTAEFWNDAGLIMELTGQYDRAQPLYGLAGAYRPYFAFFVFEIYEGLSSNLGNPGARLNYYLGYGTHYMAGSRFGHATNTTLLLQQEENLSLRRQLAEQAIASLSVCVRRGIWPLRALALRGRIQFLQNDFAAASADLERAIGALDRIDVAAPSLLVQAAMARIQASDAVAALPYLDRAAALDPDLALVYRTRAVAQLRLGHQAAGRADLDRALRLDDQSVAGWYNRGVLNLRTGQYDAAALDLRRAAALDPLNAQVAAMLGATEIALERQRSGEPVFAGEKPIAVADAYSVEGSEAMISPLNERSVDLVENYLRRQYAGGSSRRGSWLLPPERSEAELRDAFAADRSHYNRQNLARVLIRSGRAGEGQSLLLAGYEDDGPVITEILLLEADRQLGELHRALLWAEELQRGVARNEDPYFWSLVAMICLEQGYPDQGSSALAKALELSPNNAGLRMYSQMYGD